jgi:hypothetical protein
VVRNTAIITMVDCADYYPRWESSADRAGEQSLIRHVVGTFPKMDSIPNCLEYPQSKYENLKNGFQS